MDIGTQQKALTLLFRNVQPEVLYQNIRRTLTWNYDDVELSVRKIGLELFRSIAHAKYPMYSFEEIRNVHTILTEQMVQGPDGATATHPSLFHLLLHMGMRTLRQVGDGLVCNFSEIFAWRSVYQDLGQDLLTTSFLAYQDLQRGLPPRTEFTWEAAIKTDNSQLNTLLSRGITENHCHLGGSTQNFPLSWACLMNYPQTTRPIAERLKRNLQANRSRGVEGNVWPWEERIQWAAFLRLELFKALEQGCDVEQGVMDMNAHAFHPMQYLRHELDVVRFFFGAQATQPDGPAFVLDYALRKADCKNGLLEHPARLLSGERSFLYRCFRACFDGTFGLDTQDWFYLYLLIKTNLRAELIQVNDQVGFYNFMEYQNRKDAVYGSLSAYKAEAIRLSVTANLKSQRLVSFEARIAPRTTAKELYDQIYKNDCLIDFAGGLPKNSRFFYVYHFIKMSDDGSNLKAPRNHKVRQICARQAKALGFALCRSRYLSRRIFGIDAANIEIGCRPETFATEFRYLRSLTPTQNSPDLYNQSALIHIHATYHAGEDFLDLADGLRAIDEAVRFLELHRGDRIGHALALGVDPEVHYNFKSRRITLPKQDLLDNTVWLLFRSQELGLIIQPHLRSELNTQAETLLSEIYGDYIQSRAWQVTLYEYYCAMQLRGDAPELYFVLPYHSPSTFLGCSYEAFRERKGPNLDGYRKADTIAGLYQCYQYLPEVKCAGQVICEFQVTDDYIALIRAIQDSLMFDLGQRGIMIECNPTSNFLIGTFRRYDLHPILRFYNDSLVSADASIPPSPQLCVSINTDDLGVFDTTLENEYAILAASLERAKMANGGQKYSNASIYNYLDDIRRMGHEQSFALTEEYYEASLYSEKSVYCLTKSFSESAY